MIALAILLCPLHKGCHPELSSWPPDAADIESKDVRIGVTEQVRAMFFFYARFCHREQQAAGGGIRCGSVKDRVVDGVRRLSELKLWEISLVTFPTNPAARATRVKTVEDFSKELQDFREVLSECRRSFARMG